MTSFQAFILGLIQGLSEFLPISSSAHLTLAPWVFGWKDPGLAFDVALHIGTLVAILWYFKKDWKDLISSTWRIITRQPVTAGEKNAVMLLIIATIPAALAGPLLNDMAETTFRAPWIIGCTLILLGIVLWLVDKMRTQIRNMDSMNWKDALLIGLAQVCSLVPGVSRSGSTMTMGRALSFSRETAARFSFLMSMPITAAAIVFKVPEAVHESGITMPLLVGVLASAISGWITISVLLHFVRRHSYGVFALYRIILGLIIFALLYTRYPRV